MGVKEVNHAYVFPAQGFLGFQLCTALLEEGWEVTALDSGREMGDHWMEIGRNANLHWTSFETWDRLVPSGSHVYLPYYDADDLLTEKEGKTLMEQAGYTIRVFSHFQDPPSVNPSGADIYVPTLIGVRQPESYHFARLIKDVRVDKPVQDDPTGVIYVKDAARKIISCTGEKGELHLKGERAWADASALLTEAGIPQLEAPKNIRGKEISVMASKSLENIFDEQLKEAGIKKGKNSFPYSDR
jgi:hypothetical protein